MAPSLLTDQETDEIIQEFDLADGDLDEIIYEACNKTASQRVNNGEYDDGLDFWDGYEQLHDEADRQANRINNRGTAGQLEFIAELCETKDALRSLLHDLCA